MKNFSTDKTILALAAVHLEKLKDEIVFLSGATIAEFITEPQYISIRETFDVDCVVEVSHRLDYEEICKKLRALGFNEDTESNITCRFVKGSIVLDVMPTEEKILGFTNIWYKEGVQNAIKRKIDGVEFSFFDLPYLIATKIEAYKGRGKGQFRSSHDIEDIITLFDGRPTISFELKSAPESVKKYLKKELKDFRTNSLFIDSLEAHISDRVNLLGRKKIILDRIDLFLSD